MPCSPLGCGRGAAQAAWRFVKAGSLQKAGEGCPLADPPLLPRSEANPHANGNLPGLFFFYDLSPIKVGRPAPQRPPLLSVEG